MWPVRTNSSCKIFDPRAPTPTDDPHAHARAEALSVRTRSDQRQLARATAGSRNPRLAPQFRAGIRENRPCQTEEADVSAEAQQRELRSPQACLPAPSSRQHTARDTTHYHYSTKSTRIWHVGALGRRAGGLIQRTCKRAGTTSTARRDRAAYFWGGTAPGSSRATYPKPAGPLQDARGYSRTPRCARVDAWPTRAGDP